MQIEQLDHLVLTVRDIPATVTFYTQVLGMERREFGRNRVALHFGTQKINLHQAGQVLDSNVRHATPGSADLCFISRATRAEITGHLASCGVRIIEGPVVRTGAVGAIESVYVYDPDENLIEIARRIDDGCSRD